MTPLPQAAPKRRPLIGGPRTPPAAPHLGAGTAAIGGTSIAGTSFDWLSRGLDLLNRGFARTPPGRVVRRRLREAIRLHEIPVRLGRGAPGIDGLRLAFVSDLHAGMFMDADDVAQLFARIAAAAPDVVCLGGDLVNARLEDLLPVVAALEQLAPPLGVFAVPGNHDYQADPEIALWTAALEHAGVQVLRNESWRVERRGAGLWIAGLDDWTDGRPDIATALSGIPETEPIVLLSHHPDPFLDAAHMGCDLTLSGHTHGGQIAPFGRVWIGLRHSRLGYWRGFYERDGARLFVGCGAGVTTLPIRLGAPAEVPLLKVTLGDGPKT